jgi:hypothetical protein
MRIINKTPHDVNVIHEGKNIRISPEPRPIRLQEHYTQVDAVNGIPVYKKHYGAGNLPPRRKDTVYIVSLIVAITYPDREDFLVVNETVRDEKGQTMGCESFARV